MRLAALAIRGYRRWLSGRGPLRRVRCTFERTESCSAYGLRAVEELSTSLPHAMRLVRARIRACRCTSVYRFAQGIGWESDHEQSPAQLVDALAARGERPETIAQVLAARTMVARWRGDRAAFIEATRLEPATHVGDHVAMQGLTSACASDCTETQRREGSFSETVPIRAGDAAIARQPIPIRAGDAAIRYHRRAMWRGLAVAIVALAYAALSAVLLASTVCTIASVLLVVGAMRAAHSSREAARRLETQRIAATFLRPAISPPRTRQASAESPMMA